MFSRISVALAKTTATTLPKLHEVMHNSFDPEPISADINNVWDIKSWLSSHLSGLRHHSRPHAFRFKKNNDGLCEMHYRNWSHSGKKEWRKPEEPLEILDKVVKGVPEVSVPEYRKCPTIEELQRGLDTTRARLGPDDVQWWEKYINEESMTRQRWEATGRVEEEVFTLPRVYVQEPVVVKSLSPGAKKRVE